MRNQAGFGASKRQNVYCGYSRDNNYIAGSAHNLYSDNCAPKHNFLAPHNDPDIPVVWFTLGLSVAVVVIAALT